MEKKITRLVSMNEDELRYIKEKGIVITKFFRQALQAEKEGKWKYNPL